LGKLDNSLLGFEQQGVCLQGNSLSQTEVGGGYIVTQPLASANVKIDARAQYGEDEEQVQRQQMKPQILTEDGGDQASKRLFEDQETSFPFSALLLILHFKCSLLQSFTC